MAENCTTTQIPSLSEPRGPRPETICTQHKVWIETQNSLKQRLITEDDFTFKLPNQQHGGGEVLKYVGGVDVSYTEKDPSVPILLELLENMRNVCNPFYPQILIVDGNGLLHPRGFGLACHLGVLANIPTIGIGKNLHHVDGLTSSGVRQLLEARQSCSEDFIALKGSSGRIWGVAMKSAEGSLKPIFISVGHRISLCTATGIVKLTCKYRVPEPVRQADIRSREYLRKHQ